jgi:hypothetical protein
MCGQHAERLEPTLSCGNRIDPDQSGDHAFGKASISAATLKSLPETNMDRDSPMIKKKMIY